MSSPSDQAERFGPIYLAPGITRLNVAAKLLASFVSIAMLSGMSFLQGYILTEHLQIPRAEQGTISGNLAFWTEIVALLLFNPFGIIADRIGRRPVLVFGMCMAGLSFGLYPYAQSTTELFVYRLVYAVGLAATSGMLATLTNDYPEDRSRGKLIGLSAMFNVLGTIFMASFVAQIPRFMSERGYDPVAGGTTMYLFTAMLVFLTAVVAATCLAPGTPVAKRERARLAELLTTGVRSCRNPRIALAYASAFAARSDMVIKALFLALWAIQAGREIGLRPDQAIGRFGIMYTAMYTVSFVSAPVFGWFIDRVNRVTSLIVALAIASAGYGAMGIVTSPLEVAAMPYLMLLTLGSSCMLKASLSLVGQEAPPRERGSIIAFSSMCGAIGILIFTAIGGRLFDSWAPWAPFVVAGIYQFGLLVIAGIVRVVAPGPAAPAPTDKTGKPAYGEAH
jgi:MFS family permease